MIDAEARPAVTDAMLRAALATWLGTSATTPVERYRPAHADQMRAVLEAALRAQRDPFSVLPRLSPKASTLSRDED